MVISTATIVPKRVVTLVVLAMVYAMRQLVFVCVILASNSPIAILICVLKTTIVPLRREVHAIYCLVSAIAYYPILVPAVSLVIAQTTALDMVSATILLESAYVKQGGMTLWIVPALIYTWNALAIVTRRMELATT